MFLFPCGSPTVLVRHSPDISPRVDGVVELECKWRHAHLVVVMLTLVEFGVGYPITPSPPSTCFFAGLFVPSPLILLLAARNASSLCPTCEQRKCNVPPGELILPLCRFCYNVSRNLRAGQAALSCIRILRHLPEHVEDFMERIMDVLKDRHHGVLVAGVQLITAVVASDPKVGGGGEGGGHFFFAFRVVFFVLVSVF